jgi:tRNA A-37 threonylcarbamoyl transferase component Bud32
MEDYQELEEIGSGGLAVVYKARQLSLNREVAIKKLHPHLLEKSELVERFFREARIAASLAHQNIVTVHHFGREANSYFIVMEYLPGRDLEYYLSEASTFPSEIGLIIIAQICEGLAYAHTQGVIHRDLKPANIIISPLGLAKLTDFGIAHIKEAQPLTSENTLLGTAYYIAPEQITGGKVTPQTDIFALGVILYRIFCRKFPFTGKTAAETLSKITHGNFNPPRDINPAIPENLEKLVVKCLANDPRARYQRVEELTDEINSYLQELGLTNPTRELRNYLSSPEEYSQKLKTKVIHHYLEKGKDYQRKHQHCEAITQFELVLALEPENEEVRDCLTAVRNFEKHTQTETLPRPIKGKRMFGLLALLGICICLAALSKLISLPLPQKLKETQKVIKLPEKRKNSVLTSEKEKPKLPTLAKKEEPRINKKEVAEFRKEKFGYLTIYSFPYTEVYINDKFQLKAPFAQPLKLPVKEYKITLKHPRYPSYQGMISIKENQRLHCRLVLLDAQQGVWERKDKYYEKNSHLKNK